MYTILFILAFIGIGNAVYELINHYKRNKDRCKMIEDFEKKHPGTNKKQKQIV